jgi:putative ABC transport system substrate-binding protein
MRRREFIAGLGGAAAWPVVARAQQPVVPVIGWLDAVPGSMDTVLPLFTRGLAETGYIVGRNVTIEPREGNVDRMPAFAADLVRRHVTVIIAAGLRTVRAAKAATQTIPIVFAMTSDPVEDGVVASLNRPSGNLTGVVTVGNEIAGKRFQLLHNLVPTADPIAMLARTSGPANQSETRAMQTAARVLGVRLLALVAETPSEVAAAFAALVQQHAGALVISSSAFSLAANDQIISLAGRYAVPTLFFSRALAARGGLASYGTQLSETLRQMGVYTGRILKGEKPADLPIVQPEKFEFVINLKTAKALGLTTHRR